MSDSTDKTFTTKLWALRLGSIPILLLFPCVCMLGVAFLADRLWNNDFPMGQVLAALVLSGLTVLFLLPWTVFASRHRPLRKVTRLLMLILAFELLVPLSLWLIFLPERPYAREDLDFQKLAPPTIEITGTWEGSWTDPRKEITENITLRLEQDEHIVTGTIVDASGGRWIIIEGKVSNDQMNLFYDREFAFRSRGATLMGTLKDRRLTGDYYGHGQTKAGWSSRGSWQARRVAE